MTRRLTLVIVGVIVATLFLVGGGTIVLANVRARHTTERDLRGQVESVAAQFDTLLDVGVEPSDPRYEAAVRRRLRQLSALKDLVVFDEIHVLLGDAAGQLPADELPIGVRLDDIDPPALATGATVSGNSGNTVFAAAASTLPTGRLVVVVLTRQANAGLGASVRFFLLVAAATVALGVLIALLLGRRLSKPIRDASVATQRIAAGQLATRVAVGNAHDEVGELARSINEMASSLQRARMLEQQFLLSVSHDLRTPLTSIRGYAEAITDGNAEPLHAAGVIRSESQRLERLVADLLDLAKVQASSFSLTPVTVDLAAAVATASMGFTVSDRGIVVRTLAPDPVTVRADPDRLAQVLANLLENACKYAAASVVITARVDGDWGEVTVDDDGPGIAATDLPHVFERLYVARAVPDRRENASGLGLAIVRELVTAMGGSVAAGVAPTGGARLSFRLPRTG